MQSRPDTISSPSPESTKLASQLATWLSLFTVALVALSGGIFAATKLLE